MKKRIDLLLLEKGLVSTREKAKELIKSGSVEVSGKIIDRASKKIEEEEKVILINSFKYVGRGGYKLEYAIDKFNLDVKDKICLDLGSSTGGFVDCLLQKGARRVYAVEIGKDQLDKKLIGDNRVINLEGTDMRKKFELKEKVDFCSIDLTFVSFKDAFLGAKEHFKSECDIVALIKPPFERKFWEGIKAVRREEDYENIFKNILEWCKENHFNVKGLIISPIKGKEAKQKEFLMYITNY